MADTKIATCYGGIIVPHRYLSAAKISNYFYPCKFFSRKLYYMYQINSIIQHEADIKLTEDDIADMLKEYGYNDSDFTPADMFAYLMQDGVQQTLVNEYTW